MTSGSGKRRVALAWVGHFFMVSLGFTCYCNLFREALDRLGDGSRCDEVVDQACIVGVGRGAIRAPTWRPQQ
jgi:hypothetical protein